MVLLPLLSCDGWLIKDEEDMCTYDFPTHVAVTEVFFFLTCFYFSSQGKCSTIQRQPCKFRGIHGRP